LQNSICTPHVQAKGKVIHTTQANMVERKKRQVETQKCIHIGGSPSFTPCLGVFKLFKLVELCGLWQVSVIHERCFVNFCVKELKQNELFGVS